MSCALLNAGFLRIWTESPNPTNPLRAEVHSQRSHAEMQFKRVGDTGGWGKRISWGSGKVPLSWVSTRLRWGTQASHPTSSLPSPLQPQAWAATGHWSSAILCYQGNVYGGGAWNVYGTQLSEIGSVWLGSPSAALTYHRSLTVFACMDLMHQSLILPVLLLCCASVSGCACWTDLLAVLNTPGCASSLPLYVIFASAAVPLIVLDYTDIW